MRKLMYPVLAGPIAALIACSVAKTSDRTAAPASTAPSSQDAVVAEQTPPDSTGQTGAVGIAFGSANGAALMLGEITSTGTASGSATATGSTTTTTTGGTATAPATTTTPPVSVATAPATGTAVVVSPVTVKIGANIVLDQALFNIAVIKIKAAKEQSDDEKSLCREENDVEASAVSAIDHDDGDDSLALGDQGKKNAHGPAASGSAASGKSGDDLDAVRQAGLEQHKSDLHSSDSDELNKEVDADRNTRLKGPYIYDAISGSFDGKAPSIDLADGSYRRIEFQLKRSWDERMLGDTFLVHGSVAIGAKTVPFVIASHVAMNFRLVGDDPFVVSAAKANQLNIVFDMSGWFDGVDLTKATVDEDGTIYINKTMNHDLLMQIRENIKLKVSFAGDTDGQPTAASGKGVATDDADNE